ncbi:MAG TPA: NAD(+) diphosphatase [Roseiflexaceae bacterium]|nr:NAD(+) diphosphatase [Roseiflexaceae bacterium]
MTTRTFRRLFPPSVPDSGPAYWLLFHDADLLMPADGVPTLLAGTSAALDGVEVGESFLLGTLDGQPLLVGVLPADAPIPAGYQPLGLRDVLAQGDAELISLASYAAHLTHWNRSNRFCPTCGLPLSQLSDASWGRGCANGHTLYPPVSPATIVLIHDGDRVLLTSKPGWGKRYSLVAGFLEPGETLEECVAREVREEVGVEVADIQYVRSQAWPFPQQIMVGFLARYASGDIAVDTSELADAQWFTRDTLPELPPPYTISRQIIELWRNEGRSALEGWKVEG